MPVMTKPAPMRPMRMKTVLFGTLSGSVTPAPGSGRPLEARLRMVWVRELRCVVSVEGEADGEGDGVRVKSEVRYVLKVEACSGRGAIFTFFYGRYLQRKLECR